MHRCVWGYRGNGFNYLGQDHAYFLRMLDQGDEVKIHNLWLGYMIMGPILVFIGALIAWASDENDKLKLLALAVSAPALITTYAGGSTATTKFALGLITPAYAEEATSTQSTSIGISDAVKLWDGIGRDDQQFRVIAGSFKSEDAARAKASAISKAFPCLW